MDIKNHLKSGNRAFAEEAEKIKNRKIQEENASRKSNEVEVEMLRTENGFLRSECNNKDKQIQRLEAVVDVQQTKSFRQGGWFTTESDYYALSSSSGYLNDYKQII